MIELKDYFMRPRQSVDFDPEVGFYPRDDEPQETAFNEEIDESEPAISKKLVALALMLFALYFFMLGRESVKLTQDSNPRPLPAALTEGGEL